MNALSSAKVLSAVTFAAALSACAGLPPGYGQLDGHRYHLTSIDTYPVKITRVDNRDTIGSLVFVDPGSRQVTVQGPPDGVHRLGEQRSIDLNVAPCTRYYLVAVKPNRLMTDFSVKVDHQEPIGGCSTVASK